MAVTSNVNLLLELSGDVVSKDIFSFAENAVSPGQIQVIDLASGSNTITVPTGGSSVPTGVILIPPAGNAVVLTLKGVTGDTGIAIGLTDPMVLSLAAGVANFDVTTASAVAGFRFIFF